LSRSTSPAAARKLADATIEYFRGLFEYERNSNAKSLAALDSVPEGRRNTPEYRRALDMHAHIAASRLMWLHRLGAEPSAPTTYNPANLSRAEVGELVARMEDGWARYLASLSNEDMEEPLEYASMASGRFRSTKSEIFTHLAGHTWYHRGQIAMLLRALGIDPPMTDHMFWSRTKVEG
jgi:uncharacterized damage-inducible protein DinB